MKRIALVLKILGVLVLVGIMSFSVLHNYLLDGLDGWFFRSVLDFEEDEDTVYAPGYTDKGFRQIKRGMTEQEVLKILGAPLGEVWIYETTKNVWISFENNRVYKRGPYNITRNSHDISETIRKGMRKEEVIKVLGIPERTSWMYSESPGDRSYRIRTIILKDDKVAKKIHQFYVD